MKKIISILCSLVGLIIINSCASTPALDHGYYSDGAVQGSTAKITVDKNEKVITTNLKKFTEELKDLENNYLRETLNAKSLSVTALTENLDYLFNELNIFANHVEFSQMTSENIDEIMKESGSKIIVSDKWLKKEVISEIEKKGGKFIVLDTFNIPRELNEKMDPDGYLKGMKEDLDKLAKALK